ncbi:MAG: succinate dehydrogenase cytochrome b subunit [Flammeovirgaceae bacterium]
MSWLTNALTSSIGRKLIMSLTGLFLISFLVVHLSGNISLLFKDRTTFNAYTAFMSTHWTIRIMEVGLVLGFVLHIANAVILTRKNRGARPVKYAYEKASANSSWFSRNMGLTGFIILLFLLLHLYQFWFSYKFGEVALDEAGVKDMYAMVHATFDQPIFLGIYVLTFVLLAFHLNHGFQSAFQSLGLNHVKYTPFIKTFGSIIAFAIPLGFIVIAVGCLFV